MSKSILYKAAKRLKASKTDKVAEGASDYAAQVERVKSPQNRKAVETLFSATPDDLRKAYKPGGTETR